MTIEMTYGRAGFAPRWVEPDDIRSLGASLAASIPDYYSTPAVTAKSMVRQTAQSATPRSLKYPELYPPTAKDELKR